MSSGRGKSPRIKACAMDGTKEIMRDVFAQQKLVFIILHGRKMMNSASKNGVLLNYYQLCFQFPQPQLLLFYVRHLFFRYPLVLPMQTMVYFVCFHTFYYGAEHSSKLYIRV